MSYPKIFTEIVPIEEEYACIHITELYEIWENYINNYGRPLERRNPSIYRWRVRHTLDNFDTAIKIWITGLKKSSFPGYNIRHAIEEHFGYFHPGFYYYMRYLGLYAESIDFTIMFPHEKPAMEGFLYNPIKIVVTGRYKVKPYRKKYGPKSRGPVRPMEFQIELVLTAPCLRYDEVSKEVCIEFHYLWNLWDNVIDIICEKEWEKLRKGEEKISSIEREEIISEIEEAWYNMEREYPLPGLKCDFVGKMKSEVKKARRRGEKVIAVEIDFGGAAWGFERQINAEWCLFALQAVILRYSLPMYEYYAWLLRDHYPNAKILFATPVTRRILPFSKVTESFVIRSTGVEWLEEELPKIREELIEKARKTMQEVRTTSETHA